MRIEVDYTFRQSNERKPRRRRGLNDTQRGFIISENSRQVSQLRSILALVSAILDH
jgi:hypothetical protein